ncbi:hypothetical protein [Polaribacter aquimarinus]|uniref:Uncharacterized protein n=1 Tax=Polaribacter aquimarinus TaxID=2100726 RepID=A0A2U2J9C3_9FLAO|nr:hypothetical protein [Polaribacter aquimarinus]PWG04946.1 hypothetical protein DIS07_10785 [Polaribacter aquimarinus]
MTIQDLVGNFSIIGSNQDDSENTYTGELNLSLNQENQIIAKWLINKNQQQFGIGFFENNTLIINFQYQGDENNLYKGTVTYKCLTKDILEGTWIEEYGNPEFLGTENCFRINEKYLN